MLPAPHQAPGRCAHAPLGFVHQQKSAGTSLRRMLRSVANGSDIAWDDVPWRDGHCTCGGKRGANAQRVWAFSDEAPDCDSSCPGLRWITLFRDPWERMKSAYYYCHAYADQLCYMPEYQPKLSPCEFGRQWGNYQFAKLSGLRWFDPAFKQLPCARSVLERAPRCAACSASDLSPPSVGSRHPRGCPPSAWCRRAVIRACGLDTNASAASTVLFRLVAERMQAFAAVGLLERLDDSLRLFAHAARCGSDDVLRSAKVYQQHNSLKRSQPGQLRKLEAQFDACRPSLMAALRLDHALYAHARQLFQSQLRQIEQPQSALVQSAVADTPTPPDATLHVVQLLQAGVIDAAPVASALPASMHSHPQERSSPSPRRFPTSHVSTSGNVLRRMFRTTVGQETLGKLVGVRRPYVLSLDGNRQSSGEQTQDNAMKRRVNCRLGEVCIGAGCRLHTPHHHKLRSTQGTGTAMPGRAGLPWTSSSTRAWYHETECPECRCERSPWPVKACNRTLIPSRYWYNASFLASGEGVRAAPIGFGSQLIGAVHMAAFALARGEGFQLHNHHCPKQLRQLHSFCWFAPVSTCGETSVNVCQEERSSPRAASYCTTTIDEYVPHLYSRPPPLEAPPILPLAKMCQYLHGSSTSQAVNQCARDPLYMWRSLAQLLFRVQPEYERRVQAQWLDSQREWLGNGPTGYGEYDAVHIRRTDKILLEAKAYPICSYANTLAAMHKMQLGTQQAARGRHVFVATDEPQRVLEFSRCRAASSWRVQSFGGGAPGRGQEEDVVLRLWAELTILRHAALVVGTLSSNLGTLVQLLRTQPEQSFRSLDVHCARCPDGHGFCPEPALRWMCLQLEGWSSKEGHARLSAYQPLRW